MYNAFRHLCERVLRIPPEPEPPPGDEAKTQIFCAAPNYYKYLLAIWALKSAGALLISLLVLVLPLIGLLVETSRGRSAWPLLIMIVPGLIFGVVLLSRLFALAVVRLDFEKRWYVVTDRSLRVREGVFLVREATVTFANIQNISISEGPIQRLLGIADLRVDTAGGGGAAMHGQQGMQSLHTTWFRGVNNAKEIRELMQQRLRHLKDAGLGDHEDMAMPVALTFSSSFVAALREVHAEATALQLAARGARSET